MTSLQLLTVVWISISVAAGIWLASLLIDGDDFPDY